MAVAGSPAFASASTRPSDPVRDSASRPLRILVTNDDGIGAPGIDALVTGLLTLPDVEVTVIAPASNQSGTGNRTTPGPLLVVDAPTASGFPGKAVGGFPADSIVWAIDQGNYSGLPDLVVAGSNAGQNIGWVANEVSGTVGAVRAAALRGIPAVAVNQGLGDEIDYAPGVQVVLDWISDHRSELGANDSGVPVAFTNINVPTCAPGTSLRGVVEVPGATVDDGRPVLGPGDCASTLATPVDDVDAFNNGFAAVSLLPAPIVPDSSPASTPAGITVTSTG